jgi:GGDEF domain-containing protein
LRTPERAAARRLQLRFAEPQLEHRFLTGLLNRAALGEQARSLWQQAQLRAAARQYPA